MRYRGMVRNSRAYEAQMPERPSSHSAHLLSGLNGDYWTQKDFRGRFPDSMGAGAAVVMIEWVVLS